MELNTCKTCGGALYREGNDFVCEACGNRWIIDRANDVHAVQRANAWEALRQSDFEKATELFEEILLKDAEDYEAYWGRALSLNGILYVTDYNERKKVPTCNNISEESFLQQKDVQDAISLAPAEMKATYQQQAEQIEKIRIEWLEKARKEPPYDIFLCYKDSDRERGVERTQDSIDAQDLYNALTSDGFKVFFSRISLLNKISEQYEPYIYNALKTAKVMIVFGENPDYFRAVWVKNEWGRFVNLIGKGEKHQNSLVVAYKNIDPGDLPIGLKNRQCLNAGEMTFLPVLMKHIQHVIEEWNNAKHAEKPKFKGILLKKGAQEEDANAPAQPPMTDEEKFNLAQAYAKDKQWEEAAKLLEEILAKQPDFAEVLLYSLHVKHHCPNLEEMLLQINSFKEEDFAAIERILGCAKEPLLGALLEKLYMVGEFSQEATFERLLRLILPYKFEQRKESVDRALETATERMHFSVFNQLLKGLDANATDEYIRYNVTYADTTNVVAHKKICLKNVLGVDMGNVGALKVLLDVQIGTEDMPVVLHTFEEMLKYSSNPDAEIVDMFVRFSHSLHTMEHCAVVRVALNYYQGELKNIHNELLDVAFRMIDQGFFEAAEDLLTQVRMEDKENARAYWGICLAKLRVKTEEEIATAGVQLTDLPEYNKYIFLIDPERRDECLSLTGLQRKHRVKTKWAIFLSLVAAVSLGSTVSTIVKEQIDMRARGYCEMMLIEDSYYTVTGVSKDKTEYVIPAEYKGKPVKSISSSAFYARRDLTDVTIPDSVTSIGAYSFYACRNLTSLDLPSQLKTIAEGAFGYAGVTELKLPKGVEEIGAEAFANSSLVSITIPDTLKEVSSNIFKDCKKLTHAVVAPSAIEILPSDKIENVTVTYGDVVAENTFSNFIKLKSVTLPKTVTEIGDGAFRYCSSLEEIVFPETLTAIGNFAFANCAGLESVEFPAGIKSIGMGAFMNCGLTSLTIPEGIKEIGNSAFDGCKGISEATLPMWAVRFVPKVGLETVTVTSGTEIPMGAFQDASMMTKINLPIGVAKIGDNAFSGCTKLENIHLGAKVTEIGKNAFENCESLTAVTLPSGVVSLGEYAFSGCKALTEITLPQGLTKVENNLFAGSGLTSIALPDALTEIGENAFSGCTMLETMALGTQVTKIGNSAFYQCTSLAAVTFPDGLLSIGMRAFEETALANVVLPDSVESVGTLAFANNAALIDVTLGGGLQEVLGFTFYGCPNLINVAFGENIKKIGASAFESAALTSLLLPNGLQEIGSHAFYHCSGLTEVRIPNGVTAIGEAAFSGCENLTSAMLPASVTTMGERAFHDSPNLTVYCETETPYETGIGDVFEVVYGHKENE